MGAASRTAMGLYYAALQPVQRHFRGRRMRGFVDFVADLPEGARVLDLGGQPRIWRYVPRPLSITILNLPGIVEREDAPPHRIDYVEGDACAMPQYADGEFDLVFSNSVIEHVGDAGMRAAFAREARRVGRRLWVQTPSRFFPVDPHTGMPFWWEYPDWLRRRLIARWERLYPAWTEMVKGTTVVSRAELEALFPGCEIRTERALGLPKSYVVAGGGGGA